MTATVATQARGQARKRAKSWLWTLLALVIIGLMLFPFYEIVNISFMHETDILQYPPPFFPPHPTLDGYRQALSTAVGYIQSSLIYALGTVVITLLVATPAAYALARVRAARIGSLLLFVLILAQMAPGIVVAISLYAMFSHLHLLNSYLAVILADSTIAVPFAIIVMRAFMIGIPQELADAAVVDGAGHWRIFWSIILPLSRTALITASLFSFLFGWGDFLFALILNSNPHHTPITVGIYRFIGGFSVEWPSVMATAVIAAIPATILLTVAQRYIAAGITVGALKE
ncbi:MAG: carbohydrate ABC transporter permease [Anaerolineales bacterium]|jgi:multiple sugar transport system permease protein